MTDKILFTLPVNLARSDRHDFICNFASISCGLSKWSELFGCFIATSSEIGKKIKYLQAKKKICRESKDYVIAREITTVLKLTVDNAILELCDSCNLLAL